MCHARAGSRYDRRIQSLPQRVGEGLFGDRGVRDRRAEAELDDTRRPVRLIAEHRSDNLRDAGARCSGGRAGAAVMHDGRDAREQQLVAHVADGETITGVIDDIETSPATRDEDAPTHGACRADQRNADVLRSGHAAETDEDRRFTGGEKRLDILRKRFAIG